MIPTDSITRVSFVSSAGGRRRKLSRPKRVNLKPARRAANNARKARQQQSAQILAGNLEIICEQRAREGDAERERERGSAKFLSSARREEQITRLNVNYSAAAVCLWRRRFDCGDEVAAACGGARRAKGATGARRPTAGESKLEMIDKVALVAAARGGRHRWPAINHVSARVFARKQAAQPPATQVTNFANATRARRRPVASARFRCALAPAMPKAATSGARQVGLAKRWRCARAGRRRRIH